jgi:hypothetical protein
MSTRQYRNRIFFIHKHLFDLPAVFASESKVTSLDTGSVDRVLETHPGGTAHRPAPVGIGVLGRASGSHGAFTIFSNDFTLSISRCVSLTIPSSIAST